MAVDTGAHVGVPLSASTEAIGYRRVLSLRGEVDVATVASLQAAVDTVLHSAERDIWIDLSGLTFMDSSGLGVLLEARDALHRDRRALSIIAPSGPVRRTIEAAGLATALALFETRRDAHRAF
jgi:anti-sigma B factor antagonist